MIWVWSVEGIEAKCRRYWHRKGEKMTFTSRCLHSLFFEVEPKVKHTINISRGWGQNKHAHSCLTSLFLTYRTHIGNAICQNIKIGNYYKVLIIVKYSRMLNELNWRLVQRTYLWGDTICLHNFLLLVKSVFSTFVFPASCARRHWSMTNGGHTFLALSLTVLWLNATYVFCEI